MEKCCYLEGNIDILDLVTWNVIFIHKLSYARILKCQIGNGLAERETRGFYF